jgi:hypothetical protein
VLREDPSLAPDGLSGNDGRNPNRRIIVNARACFPLPTLAQPAHLPRCPRPRV